MTNPHHIWDLVRDVFPLEHEALHDYWIAMSFPDTLRGRLNAFRAVEAVRSVFGPDGAHILMEIRTTAGFIDMVRHLAISPMDVVAVQAELLIKKVEAHGWLEEQDFLTEMVPTLDTYWRSMDTSDRLLLIDINNVRVDAVLEDVCPPELHLQIQEEVDGTE